MNRSVEPEKPGVDRPPWGDAFSTPERAPVVAASREVGADAFPAPDTTGDDPGPADPPPEDLRVPPDATEDGDVTGEETGEETGDVTGHETGDDTPPPAPADSSTDRRRAVTASVAAAVVLALTLGWWLTSGRVPSEVADAAYAGSLGIINDLDLVEQRALTEARGAAATTVGEADAARTIARCVRTANPPLGGPLRLAAEVRANGQDAIVLVSGANGPTDVRIVARETCAPLTTP